MIHVNLRSVQYSIEGFNYTRLQGFRCIPPFSTTGGHDLFRLFFSYEFKCNDH